MKQMRYINLFEKITGVRTRHCFSYNEFIVFAVPGRFVLKAVGKEGQNVKKLNEILGKKIKIIAAPESIEGVREFVKDIVAPVMFKDLKVNGMEIVITAGTTNKAALLGRHKRRLIELQKIVEGFFGKELKII